MKRPLALLLLAACAPSPDGATEEGADFEMALVSQLALDATSLKPGDWAIYEVRRDGDRHPRHVKYAVVGREGGALWIENRIPTETGSVIYKSKLDPSGRLLELWAGEPRGIPAQLYPPNPNRPQQPPPRRDPETAQATSQEEPDRIELRGKSYACTKITTTLVYPGGRRRSMVNWLSKDVPFWIVAGTLSYGGLVRRRIGTVQMDLFDSSRGGAAMPELAIPGK